MLVHEAAEFNSSMEPTKQTNNVEFYTAFTVSRFVAKLNVTYKMYLYLNARTLTTICPCLDAVVNDC